MSRYRAFLFAVVWLIAAGIYAGSAETPSRSAEAEQLIFQATNQFRIKNNLRPFIWDQKLSDIAYAHSADMIVREYFDHVNPDGQDATDRIHRQHRQFIGNSGENLSTLITSPPLRPALISDEAVNSWVNSPPHRQNLLDPAFTHVGIGVAVAGIEAKATQIFMQVRGILKEPLPEFLGHGEKLALDVVPFPDRSPKAERYILEPVAPGSEMKIPVPWELSVKHPFVTPGRYTIQFCFPAPRSRFLEVFPGPQLEILK